MTADSGWVPPPPLPPSERQRTLRGRFKCGGLGSKSAFLKECPCCGGAGDSLVGPADKRPRSTKSVATTTTAPCELIDLHKPVDELEVVVPAPVEETANFGYFYSDVTDKESGIVDGWPKFKAPAIEPVFANSFPYVDTHCHLLEVLQLARRYDSAPGLLKDELALTDDERKHWRTLGWCEGSTADEGNPVWNCRWADLSAAQRESALFLGWIEATWERNTWHLDRGASWSMLSAEVQRALAVLGETEASWGAWSGGADANPRVGVSQNAFNDSRSWSSLTAAERAAASALGLSQGTWDQEEAADFEDVANSHFGTGFEGCITQGCDLESFEEAKRLALAHPRVYVSFGCHPKSAWSYDDKLEAQLLAAMDACGTKAVAWGEFGLDYSHPSYGKIGENRRVQREVFARQLQLAVRRGKPLVIHARAADYDTLKMMRRWVPKHWRVHVHSFRGTMAFMDALLSEWQHTYLGFAGLVTLGDEDTEALVSRCPLDRMLIETDSPYLPIMTTPYSHPGQIHIIASKVAELQGVPVRDVLVATRRNARICYGI
eukprot:TRINITY_DN10203_c0_g2_i1.p1 TRINITY_DN10203_c0_g2~~TRINITY_DN10203_c0_g2_i1.p1  ORF type:complete len:571 (+),score=78.46 TRINITY_DN10203_c0_g2_i1:70-1713(+)